MNDLGTGSFAHWFSVSNADILLNQISTISALLFSVIWLRLQQFVPFIGMRVSLAEKVLLCFRVPLICLSSTSSANCSFYFFYFFPHCGQGLTETISRNTPLAPADVRHAEELSKMDVYTMHGDAASPPGDHSLRKILVHGWKRVDADTRKTA